MNVFIFYINIPSNGRSCYGYFVSICRSWLTMKIFWRKFSRNNDVMVGVVLQNTRCVKINPTTVLSVWINYRVWYWKPPICLLRYRWFAAMWQIIKLRSTACLNLDYVTMLLFSERLADLVCKGLQFEPSSWACSLFQSVRLDGRIHFNQSPIETKLWRLQREKLMRMKTSLNLIEK